MEEYIMSIRIDLGHDEKTFSEYTSGILKSEKVRIDDENLLILLLVS